MWIYHQDSGILSGPTPGTSACGYSGCGLGRNTPSMQDRHNVGPIPRGTYRIGDPHDTATHGPFVMALAPSPTNEMHGRAGFLIHGDNVAHNASEGCIILARPFRERIAASGDRDLTVV